MAFYAVDVRNGVIQRVNVDYNVADNKKSFSGHLATLAKTS
jgi:hypothetical protein